MTTSTVQPRAIDLYAGAGGATQGLINAGYDVVGAIEWDSSAAASYAANHPDVRLLTADIRDIDADDLRTDLRLRLGELALLQACPPCQTWSSLGKHRDDDPRNSLVLDVLRFLRAFQPQTFVVENVPGLAMDRRFAHLIRSARRLGYGMRLYRVNAIQYAVPQHRKRLILVGVRGADGRTMPRRLAEALPPDFERGLRTVGDAIGRVQHREDDALNKWRRSTPLVLERIRAIPAAGSRFDLPEHLRLTCHSRLRRRNATTSYGRMAADEPAPTLTTRCTTPACGRFIHPTEDRGLTLREAALLQTFPPDYLFVGSYGEVERQIGNAIPVRMAEGVARVVRQLGANVGSASG